MNQKNQHPPQTQIDSVIALYSNGKIQEALDAVETLTQDYPKEPLLYNISGVCYKAIGQLDAAVKSFEKALALKPDYTEVNYNLGLTFQELGQLDAAVKCYERAISVNPDHAEAHNNLGVTLKELGQLEDAIKCYEKALVIKPDYTEAHNNLGNAFKELGQLDDAVKSYEKAIAVNPDHADAHNSLGVTLKELGQLYAAVKSYEKAIAIKPDYVEAINNLGITFYQLHQPDDAMKCYEKALVFNPDFTDAYNNIGTILLERGQLDEAVKNYKEALKLEPDFVDVYNNLGVAFLGLRQLDESVKSYKATLKLEPDFAEAHNNLGLTLIELGRLEEAEESYRKAIELKPEYVEAMLNLSNLLDYMNNLEEAILLLENILKMDEGNYRLKSAVNLAIFRFLEDDFITSKKHLSEIQKTLYLDSNTYLIYWEYLLKILSSHDNKSHANLDFITKKKLYVIGESHALVSHGLHIKISSDNFICKSLLIKGCMQWHLGSALKNQYKNKFEGIFHSLRKSSEVLLAIGEIDCRLNSGIIKHKNKFPEKNITQLISTTVENYLNYIYKINSSCEHKIIIQGVPCPNISTKNIPKEKVMELINLIREFNILLKNKSTEIGFGFLDVYKLTDRGDGFCNQSWHIDEYHLSPEGIHEAWRLHSAN